MNELILEQYRFDKLRQYTQRVQAVRFPRNIKEPYMIVYFPENSTLLDDFPKLGIRFQDVRDVIVPLTKIPRTRLTTDTKKLYKSVNLFARMSTMKVPSGRNVIYDLSNYLTSIDTTFKPNNYRQRAGMLVKNIVLRTFSTFPENYRKVLMYVVRSDKDLNTFVNRKVFPILYQLKSGQIPFDDMLLVVVDPSGASYRLIVKERDYKVPRVIQYLKRIKLIDTEEEKQEEIEKATNKVMTDLGDEIPPENKVRVTGAVSSFLAKSGEELSNVATGIATKKDMEKIATASILYKASGDYPKSVRVASSVPKERQTNALKAVNKNYVDDLLPPQKTITTTGEVAVKIADPPKMVDNKSPGHIFQKRQIDFEKNLVKDMTNSFKVLEKKEVPLKITNVSMVSKSQRAGEVEKSDISSIRCTLRDEFGNTHEVEIDIPKIDPTTGTFRVNGRKKCLINQLVLCPITFPKPYDAKFESSYSAFHIRSKRTKRMNYLEIYIASYTLPLSVLLFYSFGFEETMRQYGIGYEIRAEKVTKDELGVKISDGQFMIFSNVNSDLKQELCQSFIKSNITTYKIENVDLKSKKFWNDIIIAMAGRINSTFLITSNLENIVDPVARQILINKQLPSDLELIMKYMAARVVTGVSEARNDLSNQRIRNSEVLVHLAQKRILAAYTEYKEKVLAGNKQAEFNIPSEIVIRDFNKLQVVSEMEYANPVEEMAVMTRVTPIGKGMGGIPDKRAIQLEGRNVHPSYFGNIDPLDTPEGDTIGITQQLTVDAMITSARGLFATKDITNNEGSGMLSTTTAMIPFVENNDGARVMMAANQARQALPLKDPEPPAVQSGYESILTDVLSDSYIKKAPCDGKITSVTSDRILVKCKNGRSKEVDITPIHLHSGSGKDTLSVFKAKVKAGQSVKNGQVVAEGSCISGGSISMGRTLCVAMMPYKGYNFEDGIVINERLIEGNKLNSIHGLEEEVNIESQDKLLFITEIGKETEKGEPLLRKTIGEIEQLIGYEEEDETVEMSAGQFIKKSPGGKVVDIEVFSNLASNKFPELASLIARTNKKYKKPPREKFTVRGYPIKGIYIRFRIEQELPVGFGDKLCNRHGNKGIISLIEKDKFMPTTPWGDKVDIIFNPVGLLGRMNMGQLYEMYTGLISKILGIQMLEAKSKPKIQALLKKVLPTIDMSKNKEFSTKLIAGFQKLSAPAFSTMMKQIEQGGFMPLIIPPFKAPSHKEIMSALKTLNIKTKYQLYLPEFATKTKYAVPVGYMYIYKLEHLGAMKIHGRSTGPVVQKTKQPTGGKRREGGQRLGEGDTYSLISYNCPALLAEFFGPLSDDLVTKNEIIADVVQTGEATYRPPKVSPSKDLLNSYFIAMMLEG